MTRPGKLLTTAAERTGPDNELALGFAGVFVGRMRFKEKLIVGQRDQISGQSCGDRSSIKPDGFQ
jgi:hypothetical protein